MGSRLGFTYAWTMSPPHCLVKTIKPILSDTMVIAVFFVTPIAYPFYIPDNHVGFLIGAVIVVKVATYFYASHIRRDRSFWKDEATDT